MKLRTMFNTVKSLPKKILAPLMISALVLPSVAGLAVNLAGAATQVPLEGGVKSLNVTTGETQYKESTNAKVDEVVQVELWQHNRAAPDTGTAKNNKVKFSVPTAQGKTQVITGTSSSDNSNTVTDSTTVNLSLERARIDYIPGTAKFRYNKGAQNGDKSCQTGYNYPPARCYVTVKISDEVVRGGVNLDSVRGGPLKGCNAFFETVTIQVRSKADVVSVNKYVRHKGQTANDWKTSTTAKPGDDLEYMIKFKNEGNTKLEDTLVADNLPKYHKYVKGSTKLRNGANPNGIAITNDNIVKGGINVGHYLPGAVGYVLLEAELAPLEGYEKCNLKYDLRNVGIVEPKNMDEYYNTAKVIVDVRCKDQPAQPDYACDLLKAKVTNEAKREVEFTAKASASNGATIERYRYNFGDNTQELLTDKTTVSHTYASDGQYVARVKVEVKVNGQTKVAESENCEVVLNFDSNPETLPVTVGPEQLPETGPASVIATFMIVTAAGTIAYHVVLRRLYSV